MQTMVVEYAVYPKSPRRNVRVRMPACSSANGSEVMYPSCTRLRSAAKACRLLVDGRGCVSRKPYFAFSQGQEPWRAALEMRMVRDFMSAKDFTSSCAI